MDLFEWWTQRTLPGSAAGEALRDKLSSTHTKGQTRPLLQHRANRFHPLYRWRFNAVLGLLGQPCQALTGPIPSAVFSPLLAVEDALLDADGRPCGHLGTQLLLTGDEENAIRGLELSAEIALKEPRIHLTGFMETCGGGWAHPWALVELEHGSEVLFGSVPLDYPILSQSSDLLDTRERAWFKEEAVVGMYTKREVFDIGVQFPLLQRSAQVWSLFNVDSWVFGMETTLSLDAGVEVSNMDFGLFHTSLGPHDSRLRAWGRSSGQPVTRDVGLLVHDNGSKLGLRWYQRVLLPSGPVLDVAASADLALRAASRLYRERPRYGVELTGCCLAAYLQHTPQTGYKVQLERIGADDRVEFSLYSTWALEGQTLFPRIALGVHLGTLLPQLRFGIESG